MNICRVTDVTLFSAALCHTPTAPDLGRDVARALRRSRKWSGVSGTSDGTKGGHVTVVCCHLCPGHTCGLVASWSSCSSCSGCSSPRLPSPSQQPEQHLRVCDHELFQHSGGAVCSLMGIRASPSPRPPHGLCFSYHTGGRENYWVRGCMARI